MKLTSEAHLLLNSRRSSIRNFWIPLSMKSSKIKNFNPTFFCSSIKSIENSTCPTFIFVFPSIHILQNATCGILIKMLKNGLDFFYLFRKNSIPAKWKMCRFWFWSCFTRNKQHTCTKIYLDELFWFRNSDEIDNLFAFHINITNRILMNFPFFAYFQINEEAN